MPESEGDPAVGGDVFGGPDAVAGPLSPDPALPGEPDALPPPPIQLCRRCQRETGAGMRFCRHCGADQSPGLAVVERRQEAQREQLTWQRIKGVILFYMIYLITLLPLSWLPAGAKAIGMLVTGGFDALVILGFWRRCREPLGSALRPDRSAAKWILIACGILAVLLPINMGYHRLILLLFGLQPEASDRISQVFVLAGYGLGVQLFVVALMPAIWEEIAFRGLIQGQFQRTVGNREAVFLSAALFAIIHLQWLSMPYLFVFGVTLAVLRERSGSLLPGMVLHGLHNTAVLMLERHDW